MSTIKERITILETEVAGLKVTRESARVNKEKFNASPLYKKNRDLDILKLVQDLQSKLQPNAVLSPESADTLARLADPQVYEAVEVKAGDKLVDLLATYIDRKDIYAKILAAADEAGLEQSGDTFAVKK